MADDESKSSRFKSKWGKILKQKDNHTPASAALVANSHDNSNNNNNNNNNNSTASQRANFQLDQDALDFLKPSTDRAASNRPKLDIAIAQRWPDAHDVKRAAAAGPPSAAQSVNGWRKSRRREGLTVGFVKTAPEVIGEGGDEASEPVLEIGRAKASRVTRSVSERKPSVMEDGTAWGGGEYVAPVQARMPQQDFRPAPVRRAGTSVGEFGGETPPPRMGISRTPTGFNGLEGVVSSAEEEPAVPAFPRADDPRLVHPPSPSFGGSGGAGSVVAKKQHDMRASEGRALRRASAMIEPEEEDEDQGPAGHFDFGLGQRSPPTAQSRAAPGSNRANAPPPANMVPPQSALSPDAPPPFEDPRYAQGPSTALPRPPQAPYQTSIQHQMHESPSISFQEPQSAVTPEGASPFIDPKYVKRHSRETAPQPQSQQPAQQRQAPAQPSYMRAAQQPESQPDSGVDFMGGWQPPSQQQKQQAPQPSYMGAAQAQGADTDFMGGWSPPSQNELNLAPSPPDVPYQSPERAGRVQEQTSYAPPAQRPGNENQASLPIRQLPSQSPNMAVPQDALRSRSKSPMRDRIFDAQPAGQRHSPLYARANGSSASVNRFGPPAAGSHSRTSSRDGPSPGMIQNAAFGAHPPPTSRGAAFNQQSPPSLRGAVFNQPSPPSPRNATFNVQPPSSPPAQYYGQSPDSPRGSMLNQPRASPYARGPSPNDYFSGPRQPPMQAARSPLMQLRQDDASRPSSSHSTRSLGRPPTSTNPSATGNPAADAAFADFAGRVAHMKGVLRLTAEREQPAERCTPSAWLRAGIWWYLRGKSGLEILLGQRSRSQESQQRELLTQAHVDLAKAWWILSDPLEFYDMAEDASPPSAQSTTAAESQMRYGCAVLRSHLKSLCYSMIRSNIMPPPQSLIQGQNTQIWLEYPRFTSDATSVLGGGGSGAKSLIVDPNRQGTSPLAALPLGDTRDMHCYIRFPVQVSINTDEADTDRVTVPCILTILRGQRDYQTSIAIASQSDLVSIKLGPNQSSGGGLSWHEVSWKSSSLAMVVHLPRNFDLTVRFQERDFRNLWNMYDFTSRVSHSLRPQKDETLVHEARLAEVQYTDSSNPNAFPAEKARDCLALIWERHETYTDGSGSRATHRGFRMLVVTDTASKTLSSFSHEVGKSDPLLFEFHTDAAANGTTALVLKMREEKRQCRMLLVFRDVEQRQIFYDVLNGLNVKDDETIVGKMSLAAMRITGATQAENFSDPLAGLQWQKLGVTNQQSRDPNSRIPDTVESESLRIVARHATGCITDRLNLGKGELLLRIPCDGSPSVEILRQPQQDIGMSVDVRNAPHNAPDDIADLMKVVRAQPTIRTLTFTTPSDLHAFQAAVTGHSVRYDGTASTFAISRRRMVVPIYHKWTATNTRLQIVANAANTVVQVLAFMEDFSHAEALCFQVKSTDVFEGSKGDGKGKKWGVKMVDAKFSLPPAAGVGKDGSGEGLVDEEARTRRRFVNLEGLEYREEHDDITVGFETEEERDAFAQALPAPISKRTLTLKRRI